MIKNKTNWQHKVRFITRVQIMLKNKNVSTSLYSIVEISKGIKEIRNVFGSLCMF